MHQQPCGFRGTLSGNCGSDCYACTGGPIKQGNEFYLRLRSTFTSPLGAKMTYRNDWLGV